MIIRSESLLTLSLHLVGDITLMKPHLEGNLLVILNITKQIIEAVQLLIQIKMAQLLT